MGRYTIQEIAKVLTGKNGLEQREANRFATEFFAIIQERLEQNDQVKVKGLGTWKVITVEARESVSVRTGDRVVIDEHSKISFTPDATMKELVNKPFSQFETVVLNDNVEFDDIKEEEPETESALEESEPEPTMQPLMDIVEESESEPVTAVEHLVPDLIPAVEEPEPVPEPEDESVDEPEDESVDEPEDSEDSEDDGDAGDDDESESRPWGRWLMTALCILVLMALSAFGGYYFGKQHAPQSVMRDTIFVPDTVFVPETQDTITVEVPTVKPVAEQKLAETEKAKENENPKVTEKLKEKEKPTAEPAPAQETLDQYAQKDVRVRLGAYRIVGLDHEVKVLAGQTFYSICRAHLGPDMECYVEVYNNLPQNPQIKEGQVIKIPKLQLKKRRK